MEMRTNFQAFQFSPKKTVYTEKEFYASCLQEIIEDAGTSAADREFCREELKKIL